MPVLAARSLFLRHNLTVEQLSIVVLNRIKPYDKQNTFLSDRSLLFRFISGMFCNKVT